MFCKCKELPEFLEADTGNQPVPGLEEVQCKRDAWVRLYRCPTCGQHWQIDEWEKYSPGLAIKIADPDKWFEFDDEPLRLAYLVQARGGYSYEACKWRGCGKPCLKGLAYCAVHAYEVFGLRK